jgi:hypothetical protein
VSGKSIRLLDRAFPVRSTKKPSLRSCSSSASARRSSRSSTRSTEVAADNDHGIWSAFDNHYWPALHFVDADGIIRDHHFGEGRYDQVFRRNVI